MAKTRSESNAVGNSKYTDLNMTFYPGQVDSKTTGGAGFNPNLKGFWSAGDSQLPVGQDPDYNMAEHVNALADAVIAIQRIIGANPQIDFKGVDKGTVKERISAAEDKDGYYDKRYGGQNWTPLLGQTLLAHTHGGGLTQAPKIKLGTEVTGKISKANMDLSQATGVTGADLFMSTSSSSTIDGAVNDKLSVSEGGTVRKELRVEGGFQSRTQREWTAADITSGAAITSKETLLNTARRFTGTSQQYILAQAVPNLLCGKYVLGVRVRTNSRLSGDVLNLSFNEYSQASQAFVATAAVSIKGTDFDAANKYQMFYLVFDHETLDDMGHTSLRITKAATSTSVNIDFDCAWITPVHPAVFDK